MTEWHKVDFGGICATILAVGLSLGWCGAILIASFRGVPLAEQSVHLLSTLGGAMAGAIATYLGSKIKLDHMAGERRDNVAKV